MNPTNHNPDLSRSLARHADQFARRGGSELEIDQVLARAGEIRRGRRMRATLVMAAVVAAIVVPVGIVSVGTNGTNGTNGDEQPGPAAPVQVDESPLTLDGLKQGDQPHIGYVSGGVFENGGLGVDLSALADPIREVAALPGGLLVATQTEFGDLEARYVDQTGNVGPGSWPMEGGFAVSDDGNIGAFVQPDGTPVAVQADGRSFDLARIPRGTGFNAAAVGGPDCALAAEYTGCQVWVTTSGEKPESWVSPASGEASPVAAPFRQLTDVVDGSFITGVTEVKDDLTTCYAVASFEPDTRPLWSICGTQLRAFSPDGSRLLGQPDGDGSGAVGLAVHDAAKGGDALLDLDTTRDAFLGRMVWEDDTHVLATVYEKGRWAILRIGLDGSREYAVTPVASNDDVSPPFVLPTR